MQKQSLLNHEETKNEINQNLEEIMKPNMRVSESKRTAKQLEKAIEKKIGRPFKGMVQHWTKEPYVPERRSILRCFKKFYGKGVWTSSVMKDGKPILDYIIQNIPEAHAIEIQKLIDACKHT